MMLLNSHPLSAYRRNWRLYKNSSKEGIMIISIRFIIYILNKRMEASQQENRKHHSTLETPMSKRHGSDTHKVKILNSTPRKRSTPDHDSNHTDDKRLPNRSSLREGREGMSNDPILDDQGVTPTAQTTSLIEAPKRS